MRWVVVIMNFVKFQLCFKMIIILKNANLQGNQFKYRTDIIHHQGVQLDSIQWLNAIYRHIVFAAK